MKDLVANSPRISTGSKQIDEILGGGFPKNSINLIMGQPGTGKTILVEQMAFYNAGGDRPILYITTLSEPLSKVLKYLQQFSFYDENLIGTAVIYEDIGDKLSREGVKAVLPIINEAIQTLSPKMIIIDSFKALHDLTPSVIEMRQVLYELTGLFSAYETTVFLLGEYTDEHGKQLPEFAIVDGILQLMRNPQSTRDERFLRVFKLRGSSYLEGLHGFKITDKGLEVYPRLVTPTVPEDYVITEKRITSGISSLDKLLGGGLWQGSTTLIVGSAGTGKTTIGLQFALGGVADGETTLYVNFQENPIQTARTIRNLGFNFEETKAKGLNLMYASPVELQIDSLVVTMFDHIRQKNIKRLVIDAIGDLVVAASDQQRLHDYLYALIQHFTVSGITTFLIVETPIGLTGTGEMANNRFSYMSDNIILLTMDVKEKMKRTISVLKSRGTAHDLGIYELEIAANGAVIV